MNGLLTVAVLQIAFVVIVGGAIFIGQKADARCKTPPALKSPTIPWAPVRTCTR